MTRIDGLPQWRNPGRSYYEKVLIVRVHAEILEAERLPEDAVSAKGFWRDRYRSIIDLEEHLHPYT